MNCALASGSMSAAECRFRRDSNPLGQFSVLLSRVRNNLRPRCVLSRARRAPESPLCRVQPLMVSSAPSRIEATSDLVSGRYRVFQGFLVSSAQYCHGFEATSELPRCTVKGSTQRTRSRNVPSPFIAHRRGFETTTELVLARNQRQSAAIIAHRHGFEATTELVLGAAAGSKPVSDSSPRV